MAAPHVCILQTSFAKREDTVAFLKEKVPGVRVEFITDSTLLTDVRANGGPSQAVIDRMTLYAKAAEISGADLIVNSCSTVGEVADIYAKEVNIPVMKVDLPMAQEAVRLGTKIALIATVETTLGPSQRLIEKVGAEQGKKMECTQLFGLCGHTVIGMLDALSRSKKIEYIGTRHEAVASTAADGYARITHKASVVMCHLGPGLTNVSPAWPTPPWTPSPWWSSWAMCPAITSAVIPIRIQMHEDGDQYSMLKPVCKRSWRVDDVEALPYILDKAFRLAEAGRPGPVLVDVPMDMFSREMEEDLWSRTYRDSHVTMKPALDPAAAKAIAKKLVEAKNPVLHAGGGILLAQASEELAALAEFLDIPVSRTLAGQGCLSDHHPLLVGQTGFWGLDFTHSLTTNADVILGLGTRFGEADSSSWYQGVTFDPDKTTFLQIDIDPNEIGRNYPVEIGAVGDLKIGLKQILEEVKKICPEGKSNPELREQIAAAKAAFKGATRPFPTTAASP